MSFEQQNQFSDSIGSHLNELDLSVFKHISSQTTDNDKRSLLACQRAVKQISPEYTFLEIGSYLGGSLQPFVLDDACARIYSIDKRPFVQPDERGTNYIYKNNSTARMLENLQKIGAGEIKKLVCFDGDASEIEAEKIEFAPQLCFIDGEHTDAAVWNDFQFCLKVAARNSAILFHDAAIIYNGLRRIIEFLEREQIRFRAYNLPDIMFVIELNDFPVHREPLIEEMLLNNHVGYLASLQSNDYYRRFVNKPIIKYYRRFRNWLDKGNVNP